MSNFLSKFNRKTRSDYKELYEIELSNRKKYESRYKEIKKENVELQKSSGIADLRKKMMELADQVEALTPLKEENAKLKLELEDAKGFLEQEKAAKQVLLERNKKAVEYLTSYESISIIQGLEDIEANQNLDRNTMIEMVERHLKVQNKTLRILEGDENNGK